VPTATDLDARQLVAHVGNALVTNIEQIMKGTPDAARQAVTTLLAGGHLLIEDLPGQGKTTLAKALARSIGGTFRRVQGTADLLPSDLTGVSVFEPSTGSWTFRPGPLFANVVLIDELNRSTPRTQSALLEAMAEGQVTTDGKTYTLPDPFFVVATQNPFDHAGTFPLVEGQRDRFATVLEIGHPGPVAERELLLGRGGSDQLDQLSPVIDMAQLTEAQRSVKQMHVAESVVDYVVAIGAKTRAHPNVRLGQSPRGSQALLTTAKAWAGLHGRHYVTPDDVQAVAAKVLAHRLVLRNGGDLALSRATVSEVLAAVPAPRG
jgi:MoxR-like ATPase